MRRWALVQLAVLAAGIRSKVELGHLGTSLFDQSVSLVQRVRFARLKSRAPVWWREQLAQIGGPTDRRLALLALTSWGSSKTLEQIAGEASEHADLLEDSEWVRVAKSVSRLASILERRPRVSPPEAATQIGSPRLNLLLAMRKGAFSQDLFRRAFSLTGQPKRFALEFCVDRAIAAATHQHVQWELILPLIREAYRSDAVPSAIQRRDETDGSMPEALALKIVAAVSDYPLSVISIAEASLARVVGARVKPVAQIAREEHWFFGESG
jgi:hypothetical protein